MRALSKCLIQVPAPELAVIRGAPHIPVDHLLGHLAPPVDYQLEAFLPDVSKGKGQVWARGYRAVRVDI